MSSLHRAGSNLVFANVCTNADSLSYNTTFIGDKFQWMKYISFEDMLVENIDEIIIHYKDKIGKYL